MVEKGKSEQKTKGSSNEKPFYKRPWVWIVLVAIALIIAIASGSGSNNNEGKKDDTTSSRQEESTSIEQYLSKPYQDGSQELKIANLAYDRIKSKFEDTEISTITVNENAGTDDPDDYILLLNLKWNRMNKEDTTKEMMRLYCDDLAAYMVDQNGIKMQEVTIFWEIPYHKESGTAAKCSYEQKNGKMFLSDKMGLVGDK